jgi:predicted Zn-dependent protease
MNFRWPDRRHEPMRVWVQELAPGVAGYDATYPQLVRDAFSAWSAAGVPIYFTFVTDSARGDIHVTWIDRFDGMMTGRTRWAHDQHQWIVGGNLLMALHMPDGRVLHANAVRAVALHEVGHLIGLDHTADSTSIMAPRVLVPDLSEADRRTARLVYSLPPGSLKAPR